MIEHTSKTKQMKEHKRNDNKNKRLNNMMKPCNHFCKIRSKTSSSRRDPQCPPCLVHLPHLFLIPIPSSFSPFFFKVFSVHYFYLFFVCFPCFLSVCCSCVVVSFWFLYFRLLFLAIFFCSLLFLPSSVFHVFVSVSLSLFLHLIFENACLFSFCCSLFFF